MIPITLYVLRPSRRQQRAKLRGWLLILLIMALALASYSLHNLIAPV